MYPPPNDLAPTVNKEYPIVNDSGHEARFLVDSNELYLMDDTNNYFHYNVKDDDSIIDEVDDLYNVIIELLKKEEV